MRVLIAGCGYVGSELARELAAGGDEVWALRRSATPPPAGCRALRADLLDPASLAAVPDALDAVVYATAAGERSEAAYRAAYVDGLANLLARTRAGRPPGRLLFVSSTGVYAQSGGEWVDEDSPTEPTAFSGRLLLEGEALALGAGIPACAVRFGGIYGPGRTSMLERVRRGEAGFSPGTLYTNRIHRDDCAGVLAHALRLPALPPVLLGVDSDPAPQREVVEWLAERLGAPTPRERPEAEGSRRAASNKRCSNRRLLESGYALRFPSFRDGYGALLAEASGA